MVGNVDHSEIQRWHIVQKHTQHKYIGWLDPIQSHISPQHTIHI